MHPTGLHPRGAPRPTSSKAEKDLFEALRAHLRPGWAAWHSLRVRAGGRFEGEGDFVIAIPEKGALVLEVKGGVITCSNGQWLQNGLPLDAAPRDQAHRFSRALRTRLRETYNGQLPYVAIATAFPDTTFDARPTHGDLGGAVLGRRDLPHLREALDAVVSDVLRNVEAPVDHGWIEALHRLWGESWTPPLTLGDRKRIAEDHRVALDEQQLEYLDAFEGNPRVIVTGGPGTGKTLLAREAYRRLEASGARVLYLCSTRALAVGMRADGVDNAWTVREYAVKLLDDAGIRLRSVPPPAWNADNWEEAPLRAAVDAAPGLVPPWDALVVDEAQDLSSNDWDLVRSLAGPRRLWAFGDDGQSYWAERRWPADLFASRFVLKSRYRCPEALARFADGYRPRGHGAPEPPTAPFDELTVVRAPTRESLPDRVAREVDKALGKGLKPGDIAVLSLAGLEKSALCKQSTIGRHATVRADDAHVHDGLILDTFLRFKGLERPWVVLTELHLGAQQYDVRMHIALTRATLGCVVVAAGEDVDADRRLRTVAT